MREQKNSLHHRVHDTLQRSYHVGRDCVPYRGLPHLCAHAEPPRTQSHRSGCPSRSRRPLRNPNTTIPMHRPHSISVFASNAAALSNRRNRHRWQIPYTCQPAFNSTTLRSPWPNGSFGRARESQRCCRPKRAVCSCTLSSRASCSSPTIAGAPTLANVEIIVHRLVLPNWPLCRRNALKPLSSCVILATV